MIHVYIRGRLGNQLFQYAFVRMLQHQNPEQRVVYHFDEVYTAGNQSEDFINALSFFNTIDVKESNEKPQLSFLQKLLLKLYFFRYPHKESIEARNYYQKKWLKIMNHYGLYYLDLGYFPFSKVCVGDIIVSGNFENEKYFIEIKEQILKELTPKFSLSDDSALMINIMHSCNSVCLSIRRGDFIDNPIEGNVHNVCTRKYYEDAVAYIKQHVDNPVLFIFSNDIEWVKDNIVFDIETYYEKGSHPSWEILETMSNCKHFIISNSTFHWWAQYKSTYKEKIVIAPERWFNSAYKHDIYMDNWIKIATK